MSILSYDLPGSILYHVPTFGHRIDVGLLAPILRELPDATLAHLGMMQQLGLIEPEPNSLVGFRSTTPEGARNTSR